MKTHLWFAKLDIRTGQEPCDVMLHVLKHKVYATRQPRSDQALQFYDIRMIKPPQDRYLPRHEPYALRLEVIKLYCLGISNCTNTKTWGEWGYHYRITNMSLTFCSPDLYLHK